MYINKKAVKLLAKEYNKQVSKEFLDGLNRVIEESVRIGL
jgi:hypothetical protein